MRRPWLPLAGFLLALALLWPRLQPLQMARFVPAAAPDVGAADQPGPATAVRISGSGMLPNVGASAHSVSLTGLADGRIAAAWFAGSREGAGDVAIVFSILADRAWSEPRPIVTRGLLQADTQRLIRKLGNPLLWLDPNGVLHLWFVSVSYGGWAGSALNHMQSGDAGTTWSRPVRLVTSPFLNISTLVRNPPLPLADGGIGLPVYHEFIHKRAEWLRLDRRGQVIDKVRIPGAAATLQPAVIALDETHALSLMRDAGPAQRIYQAGTDDGGSHWQKAGATTLPNPGAAVALLRLHDGSLLLAHNPQSSNRTRLGVSLSADRGKSWSPPFMVEEGGGEDEFSYPALFQDKSGLIHLAYTWQRKKIKHVVLEPAALQEVGREPAP